MTVPQQVPSKSYTGNGITTAYAIGFLCLQAGDLAVYVDGGPVDPSAYTITDLTADTGGTVTFNVAPANGAKILFNLEVVAERLLDYKTSGDFFAKTVNLDFDRLWLAIQQGFYSATRALRLGTGDVDGSGSYRANNNRIQDLGDPVGAQDATTKSYVDAADGQVRQFAVQGDDAVREYAESLVSGIQTPTFQAFEPVTLVDGVDYTSGTSNQVTLPADTAGRTIASVFFDTGFQARTTWTLLPDGVTLQFDAVIPEGVGTVSVTYFAPSLMGSFQQSGFGTIVRPFQDKMREVLSVADYPGYDPTGTTDSWPAFQAAVDAAYALGKPAVIRVPRGYHAVTKSIMMDRSGDINRPAVSFEGEGSEATIIIFTGAGSDALFFVRGHDTMPTTYCLFKGMSIAGTAQPDTVGFFNNLCSFFHYEDLHIEGFGYAFYGVDIDHTLYEMVQVRFNKRGFFADIAAVPVAASTCPNQLTFVQCQFGANSVYGVAIQHGAGNTFVGCQIEVNGTAGPDGFGVRVSDSSLQGGPAIIMLGCYFESNNGIADLALVSTTAYSPVITDATYVIIGTSFNRASDVNKSGASIVTNFGPEGDVGKQILSLQGNTFKGYGSYVPNASTPYIVYSGAQQRTKNNFYDLGNVYQSAVEAPANIQNPAKCYAQAGKIATQSIPSGALTVWDIDQLTAGFSWPTSTSTSALIVPESGVYNIALSVAFSAPITGTLAAAILRNGTVIARSDASNTDVVSAPTTLLLSAGDHISGAVAQTSGSAATAKASSSGQSFLTLTKMIDA